MEREFCPPAFRASAFIWILSHLAIQVGQSKSKNLAKFHFLASWVIKMMHLMSVIKRFNQILCRIGFFIICGCFISESPSNIDEIPYLIWQNPIFTTTLKISDVLLPSSTRAVAGHKDSRAAKPALTSPTLNRKLMKQRREELHRTGSGGVQWQHCPLSHRRLWWRPHLTRYLEDKPHGP